MPDPSPEDRAAAQQFAAANINLNLAPLQDAITTMYGDTYLAGAIAGAQQAGANIVAGLPGVSTPPDSTAFWNNWTPGNTPAGDLLAQQGGLKSLMDNAGVAISNISDTTTDRLGSILADGVTNGMSVDQMADMMHAYISDPERAFKIADTETARAVTAASLAQYEANGVELLDWLVSPDACDECQAIADNGPYALKDFPELPAHPYCRCSSAPRDPGLGAAAAGSPGTPTGLEDVAAAAAQAVAGDVLPAIVSDISEVADRVIGAAAEAEPELTSMVSGLADQYGGTMEGLDYRLKTADSLARKIDTDVAQSVADGQPLTADQAAAKMFDVNRYTTVYPEDQYAAGAQSTIDALRAAGNEVKVKNYWNVADNPYQGVNLQVTGPTGQKFELQFHTPESLATKEGDLHKIYELQRVETDPAKIAEYNQQMHDLSAAIPEPAGVHDIGQALSIAERDLSVYSDEALYDLMTQAATAADEPSMEAVTAELDARDAAAQKIADDAELAAAKAAAKDAAKQAVDDAKGEAFDAAVAAGADPEEAYADVYGVTVEKQRIQAAMQSFRQSGYTGPNFDQLSRAAWRDSAREQYEAALEDPAMRGVLLTKEARAAGIDPLDLFTGTEARARKYASDELKEYWQKHGRLTLDQFRASILGGRINDTTGYWF